MIALKSSFWRSLNALAILELHQLLLCYIVIPFLSLLALNAADPGAMPLLDQKTPVICKMELFVTRTYDWKSLAVDTKSFILAKV